MDFQPVVLLTFSNNEDDYLPMIVQEQKAIKKALLDFTDQNFLQLRDVQHASTEEVFHLINRYNQRVTILHYAGHADGESIQLEKEIGVVQTANVKGIAGLLGTQKQLKLVFLNGCASRGQVKALLDHGVPAVLATRVAINDQEAKLFASQFYEALATGSSIGEAYQKAKALIETERRDFKIKKLEETRSIRLGTFSEEEIPWGLYWKEEGAAVLDWKLPTKSPLELNIVTDGLADKRQTVINGYLVMDTLNAISKHYETALLSKFPVEVQNKKRHPSDAEMKAATLQCFLAPISVHLRALFSRELSEKYNEDRLQQLWNTYRESVKLFALVLLSDLWDNRVKGSTALEISELERVQLQIFFDLSASDAPHFDYFLLVDALLKLAQKNKISWYLKELNGYSDGWAANEKLSAAHEYFQFMQSVLEEEVPSRLIEAYCIQSEKHLANLLSEWYFLINYRMSVIKEISVQSIKNMPPATFKHRIVELDNNFNDIGDKDHLDDLQAPTEMESVLLYRDTVNESLNLSPFVLDENALTGEANSKIYFFSHSSEAGLHYYWIENKEEDTLLISDKKFAYVKRQFERARQDILNDKVQQSKRTEIAEDKSIFSSFGR